MQIRRLLSGDECEIERAAACFDHAVQAGAAKRLLEAGSHHMLLAYAGGVVAGFVSGVETTHPDKGTEMFLYELAVDERYRRKGYGKQLVEALADLARERGCYGMWVLADEDNHAALATYTAAGGAVESKPVMIGRKFEEDTRHGSDVT